MRSLTLLRTLVYCLLAIPATAQSTFAGARFDNLPTVFVTDRAGTETAGQLVELTDNFIRIQTDYGEQRFAPGDVRLIERQGDSLKNGALAGLSFGLLVDAAVLKGCQRDCHGNTAGFALLMTGIYSAIGAGIDAAIPGRTRIWSAKSRALASHFALALSPISRSAFIGWRFH